MYRESFVDERGLRQRLSELRRYTDEARAIERFLVDHNRRLALPLLTNLRVASPCSAEWDDMVGDERVRSCGSCRRPVYNLSAMTREEAERLVFAQEGRLCARFYRRSDGTVLTADCPSGGRRVRWLRGVLATALAALLAAIGLSPDAPPRIAAPHRTALPPRPHTTGRGRWVSGPAVFGPPSQFSGFEILNSGGLSLLPEDGPGRHKRDE